MTCPACAHENRPGAKFCEECATPLRRACSGCGSELRPTAKFCDECGAPVAGAPAAARPAATAGARKVVTVVFADLAGSTALHERLDPESARRVMERYYATLRAAVERHGGTVVKLLGDGVMAAFGVPQVAEDDAIRAVRAGVAMQESFRDLIGEQGTVLADSGLRVAVNTGEVVVSEANDDVVGDPVNVAARLQQEAGDGDVVIGEATRRLVASLVTLEPLGSFALKGRAEAVRAHRVVSLEAPAGATTAAFVGRDEELARITAVYEQAMSVPATRLAVLLGSPGLGKSRLIGEFARRCAHVATVVEARCDAAGGATFAPLAGALHELLGVEVGAPADAVREAIEATLPGSAADRARIAAGVAALLTGSPAAPEETFFVVRRLLAGLAATKPVVLVIDDLQWAESLLLDLVEHLVQWGAGVPLLVLVGGRPELRDVRSSFATPGALVTDVVTLAGLDAGAAMRVAANVIGAADLPAVVAAKVLATSEGNPLFIGELVRMLVHEGALTREGDRWTIGTALATLEMPPTIHALLAARIERLRPEERAVLERASVVGRHFSRSAVAELLPHDVTDLDARLESLRRSELIERDTGWLLGEPVLRFHHVLIRDAAYRRLLKETRAELHGRLADWIEGRVGDAAEHDETIGRHLEQAHELLGELGPLDEAGKRLGERAAARLAAAGRSALERDDVALAASLLGRALGRLGAEDPARADLALDWCEALLTAGDVGQAAAAIDELGRFIANSPRLRAWHTCFAGQHTVLTAPEALRATTESVEAAAEELTALGDAAGEAKAHFVHALALGRLGQVGACEAALDRALAAARRAGDRRRANTVLAIAPLAALWGPSPVTRASGRCLDVVRVLRITQGAPAVEAVALSCQGVLEALRGRTHAAKRMIASARSMVEELGITQRIFEVDVFGGLVALLEDDAAGAERSLRGSYEGLRDLGLGIDAARAAALLARALLAQNRVAEAEELSHQSEALAGDDLKAAIAWRGVRAEALAERGEHAAAVALANKGVEIAAATDALLDHADARLALAAALRAASRGREADAEEQRATELWSTKGATLLSEGARHESPPDGPVASTPEQDGTTAVHRRVPANTATAYQARFETALAALDFDAIRSLSRDDYQEIDHPTGSPYGADASLASLQRLFRSHDPTYRVEPLATLGPSLLLVRRHAAASGVSSGRYDVGAYENDAVQLIEVDEQGLSWRSEVFAADALGDAIARLYERYAEQLPAGPARERAATTARAVTAMLTRSVEDRVQHLTHPDLQVVDHRTVGIGSMQGLGVVSRWLDATDELMGETRFRVDDVLGLSADALLRRTTTSGKGRASGGTFDISSLGLSVFGPDGRHARFELFDIGHEAEALARFDELVEAGGGLANGRAGAAPLPVSPFANSAWRSLDRTIRCFKARDWDGMTATYAPEHRMDDRRRLMRIEVAGRQFFENERWLFDLPASAFRAELLASRGDRLALARVSFTAGGDDAGPMAVDVLDVVEVRADARRIALVILDPDDLDAAYAELDRRFYAGEGSAHAEAGRALTQGIAHRAWGVIQAQFMPTFVEYDHRHFALHGTTRGAEAWVQKVRVLVDLAPDAVLRLTHLRFAPGGALFQMSWYGTREGGDFEIPLIAVHELNTAHRIVRADLYDADQVDEAYVRLGELAVRPPAPESRQQLFANAATRHFERVAAAIGTRDFERFAAEFAADFRNVDRRPQFQLESDREPWLSAFRQIVELTTGPPALQVLATRGDRLALVRLHWEGEGGDVGLSEVDWLVVVEVDDRGHRRVGVTFDPSQLDAARAELDARYEEGQGTGRSPAWQSIRGFVRAVASGDWDAIVALCADGFVEYDHRGLAVLGTTHGAEAWVQNFRTLNDLSPDTVYRVDHFRPAARGYYTHGGWHGTREGGPYEIPLHAVIELDDRGLMVRADVYDDDGAEAALARLAELAAPQPPACEPFANAAWRSWERGATLWGTRNQALIEAHHASLRRYQDHRRQVLLDLDRAGFLEFARPMVDMAGRMSQTLLATRGDRLAVVRMTMEFAGEAAGPSAIDSLLMIETDERGDVVVYDRWDLDDVDAAWVVLDARFAAGEGAACPKALASFRAFDRAFAARDWDALGARLAPGIRPRDHRTLGFGGTLGDVATFLRSQQVLVELSPDVRYRYDHVRFSDWGSLTQVMQMGTRDGGRFESPFIGVFAVDEQARIAGLDVYDLSEFDEAWARFSDLSRGGGSAGDGGEGRFPNAATRAVERGTAALAARDWDGFAALFAAEFRNADRRALVQLESDREQWLTAFRQIVEMTSARPSYEVLATRGERLALFHMVWRGAAGDVGPSEIEWLLLVEVDERGDHVAVVTFDPGDVEAAYDELEVRWGTGEGAASPVSSWLREFRAALHRRDWDAVAAFYGPEFVGHDHRLVSWETLRGPAFIESVRTMVALAPDARMRADHERVSGRAMLSEGGWTGTRDGGAFESTFVTVGEFDERGRVLRLDFFDPHHLDAARARFAEIVESAPPDPLAAIARPNAANAAMDRWQAAYDIGLETDDWDPLRALCTPGFVFDDRRRFNRLSGDAELMVAAARERVKSGARPVRRLLGTAGDRVAVEVLLWSGGPTDGRFEIEYLGVIEVDESNLMVATILLDLDDPRAAQREAWARWMAIDPTVAEPVTAVSETIDSFNAMDRGRFARECTDDFVVEDHWHAGMGRLEGAEAYVASVEALWQLAPDSRLELGWHWLVVDRRGGVVTCRRTGLLADGGAYESDYLVLFIVEHGRASRFEMFEIDAAGAALARFEELRAARTP